MTKQEMANEIRRVCRVRRLSRHTEGCYLGWCLRFADFAAERREMGREERVRLFLESLAPVTAASTQNQALNAVVFFYRDVLRQPLADLGKWARAKRPARLPVWLSSGEMSRLLEQMTGVPRLMAEMAFGSGLRLAELLALRIKDVDIDGCTITVRGGKGDKDRVTCLSRSLAFRLGPHLARVRAMWEADRAAAAQPIYLPAGLERKFPRGGSEWPWYWLWPAAAESMDPHTAVLRRHHLHESTLGKALHRAAKAAGLGKRVTAHTLRHSFATAMLEGGHSITQVQELLGHSSVETTQVYLHCLPQVGKRVTSPLDAMQSNVIPFAAAASGQRVHRTA
jgi:integron integrase